MNEPVRDTVFISYSHLDPKPWRLVRQYLLNQRLDEDRIGQSLNGDAPEGVVQDDSNIQPSEHWRDRVRQMMERAAVAVLICSNNYFTKRPQGDDFLLAEELPYLLECHRKGTLVLLPIYWGASSLFQPDNAKAKKPFTYRWREQRHTQQLSDIQAFTGTRHPLSPLSRAAETVFEDVALELAAKVDELLANRRAIDTRSSDVRADAAELRVDLRMQGNEVFTRFHAAGRHVGNAHYTLLQSELDRLRAASAGSPPPDMDEALGSLLYRVLFGRPDEGAYPRIAAAAWGDPAGSQATTRAVRARIHCVDIQGEPWPLGLPWSLTRFRDDRLCAAGWSFEVTPAGVTPQALPTLRAEPVLAMLFDNGAMAAPAHATEMRVCQTGLSGFAWQEPMYSLDQLAHGPEPEVLYLYARCDWSELERLAGTLGSAAPLLVLNFVGERLPPLPPELVNGRLVIVALHGSAQADAARAAGVRWLTQFQRRRVDATAHALALDAFGGRVRIGSGCAGLKLSPPPPADAGFSPRLIEFLMDRVSAREAISHHVSEALHQGWAALGFMVAGCAQDRPHRLPSLAWHHFDRHHAAASHTRLIPVALGEVVIPRADELLGRLADHLHADTAEWATAIERKVDRQEWGERIVLTVECRVPLPPAGKPWPAWRNDWIAAWLAFCNATLARHGVAGVLIVAMLLVEAPDADEAAAWCREADDEYFRLRRPASEQGRFVHHYLDPLGKVPLRELREFLDKHYPFERNCPGLDLNEVAAWVLEQTGGAFDATVRLMEDLDRTGCHQARLALTR